MTAGATRLRRFYKSATVSEGEGGVSVLLDGKPVRTPGRNLLALPTKALAKAIAGEWNAQGDKIEPATMPITRLANTVIDGISGAEQQVRDDIAAFAGSDLLCYRAEHPQGLVAAQQAKWDPIIRWLADTHDARFAVTSSIVHVAQPEAALKPVRALLAREGPWALGALHVITTLTGSALLAVAHTSGHLGADEVWAAAHVDEDWQISQWGEDAEALARRTRRHGEMLAASRLLALSRA